MTVDRRWVLIALGAVALTACSDTQIAAPRVSGLPEALRPQPNAAYEAWDQAFLQRALRRGVAQGTLAPGLQGTGFLPAVVRRHRNMLEPRLPLAG